MFDQIIDPHLVGTINHGSLGKFGETKNKCLAKKGIDRLSMGDVLWNLEYSLKLQEISMQNDPVYNNANLIGNFLFTSPSRKF
jgi:hypothetical protein